MRILSVGEAIPQTRVTNEDMEVRLNLEPGWIERRTGILMRPIACPQEATSDLAMQAGKIALSRAAIDRKEYGILLLATSTPDHPLPPTAPLVAHQLELSNAGAVDLAGACSGFLYALILASTYTDFFSKPALVIAANILSRRVNPNNEVTAALFSDGAGAVVLLPDNQQSLLGHYLYSDGSQYSTICVPAGGTRERITKEAIDEGRHFMVMTNGPGLFKRAATLMADAGIRALAQADLSANDVDWWIPHQANLRMIHESGRILNIPKEKTISVIDRFGNSSAATIPIALSSAVNGGQIKRGDILLMTAIGAGMISAGLVLRW